MKSQSNVKISAEFDTPPCDFQDTSQGMPGAPLEGRVSERLRQARMESHVSIAEWSKRLNIPTRYLQALEEGNTSELPIRVYTFGFVKTYAQNLGLNASQILQDFKAEAMQDLSSQHLSMPQPIQGNTLPKKNILWLTFIVFLIFITLGWFYMHSRSAPLKEKALVPQIIESELLKQNPGTRTSMKPDPVIAEAADQTPAPQPTYHPQPKSASQSSGFAHKDPQSLSPSETSQALPLKSVETPPAQTPPISAAISLEFVAPTWVEIKDMQGRVILNRIFQAGESHRIAEDKCVFSTGNAGGIEVMDAMGQASHLGKPGEVIKSLPCASLNARSRSQKPDAQAHF